MSSTPSLFKKEILYNNSFPLDKRFITSVSLSRKAYEEIEEISLITNLSRRSNIIEKALEYYVNTLRENQKE